MTRALLAILAAAALGLMTGGCGPSSAQAVKLVSGRDDHGLLERPVLGLRKAPDDETVVATARDGDIALVLRREGPAAFVRLVRTGREGWIDDHYLRGEAVRLLPRPRRVTFLAATSEGGTVQVHVRYADDGSDEWVEASELREVGAQ